MGATVRGWVLTVVGWVLLLVGVVLFPLPGPGLLLMAAGLAILATQYDWAERRVDALRDRALDGARRGVATHRKAWTSLLVCALLASSGLLWVWAPAQPAWWALPGWTWLPGGLWAGLSQFLSGLLTLALVGYAYVCRLTGSGMLRP